MPETLIMSKQELERIPIVEKVIEGTLTHVEAGRQLALSERQVYRITTRYKTDGAAGLVHKLRGRRSHNRYPDALRERVVTLYRQQYGDYGPTLFSEQLAKHYHIELSNETARRWLKRAGLWMAVTKRHPHRTKRPRRESIGALVQFDGSPHDWFEGRGAPCTLLHMIDDASNRVFLRFAESENTVDCMRTMRAYIERYGIPAALYVDFGSVYKDGTTRTAFESAMADLGVCIIHAHSPQAKGRVERGNQTHQDRLVKALRQANIASIAAANAFLDCDYLREHNQRFAHTDGIPDVHRSSAGIDLDTIFCYRFARVVANDYTIQLHTRYIQLLKSEAPLPPPRTRVIVKCFLDGSLHVYWNEHELAHSMLDQKPSFHPVVQRKPAAWHPWRTKNQRLIIEKKTSSYAAIMRPP